jgi:hydrogenase maturation protease
MDEEPPSTREGKVLVVGYGNTLRRDDGLGPAIVAAVAAWNLPGVRCRTAHQIVPELAQSIASAEMAVFVDAKVDDGTGVVVKTLNSSLGPRSLGHTSDPSWLLSVARDVYGSAPRAWLVEVPAADCEVGEGLSPPATCAVERALEAIAELITRYNDVYVSTRNGSVGFSSPGDFDSQ